LNKVVLVFSLFFCTGLLAQNTLSSELYSEVEELKKLRIQSVENESFEKRLEYNQQFKEKLKSLLSNDKLNYRLDSIPFFGKVESPDKKITIYTWNILDDFSDFTYYALVDLDGEELVELNDQSKNMADPLMKLCKFDNWYGALYYEIIPTKVKKQGVHYILLGWDGKSNNGTRKVIDVLHYDEGLGNWYFGKTVFGPPFSSQTRYFIEYSSDAVVSLKYHPKTKQIVFDHVVPPNKGLKGVYDFYIPDLSFDAFEFRKDRWYFVQNVDVRGEQTMKNYVDPNKGNRPR